VLEVGKFSFYVCLNNHVVYLEQAYRWISTLAQKRTNSVKVEKPFDKILIANRGEVYWLKTFLLESNDLYTKNRSRVES
jgi:hypothetical protein